MKRKIRNKAKPARAKRAAKMVRRKRGAGNAPQANPLEAIVSASATSLGIPLEAAWREGVTFNLGLIMRHATLVDEFPLSDEAEPAPVYRA